MIENLISQMPSVGENLLLPNAPQQECFTGIFWVYVTFDVHVKFYLLTKSSLTSLDVFSWLLWGLCVSHKLCSLSWRH